MRTVLSRAAICVFVLGGILCTPVYSQSQPDDFMRSTGKIYVVVASLVVIFLLIVVYLISLDRKISKLEKQQRHGEVQ